MKRTPLFLAAAAATVLCSCTTAPGPQPIPAQPPPVTVHTGAHWIPNWATDTMVAYLSDGRTRDTIYSYTRGDTSMVTYRGTDYYVWTQAPDTAHPNYYYNDFFVYTWVYMGVAPMDIAASVAGGAHAVDFGVYPSRWFDETKGVWVSQDQQMMVYSVPPFPSGMAYIPYSTGNK